MISRKSHLTTDSYFLQFPNEIRVRLEKIRAVIKKAAPDAEEKISYQMPAYFLNGALVYFAGYRNHIGFYPTSSGINAFKKEISSYKNSKGTVQFPHDKPLPAGLITKIVKHRIKTNLEKVKNKRNN